MKTLKLNAMGRLLLLRTIPQGGTLNQIAVYLRILEALHLKGGGAVGGGLAQLAGQWDQWPTAQESLALKEKLGL